MRALISYSAGIDSTVASFLYRKKGYDVTLATFNDGPANYGENLIIGKPIDKEPFFEELLWYQKWLCKNYIFNSAEIRYISLNQITAKNALAGNKDAQFAESLGLNFYIGFKLLMAVSLLSYGSANSFDVVVFGHMPYNSHYRDESLNFFTDVHKLMNDYYGDRIYIPTIEHPFYSEDLNTKEKVIKLGMSLGVPFEYTYSCRDGKRIASGQWKHCGVCENCLERSRAFTALNILDPAP